MFIYEYNLQITLDYKQLTENHKDYTKDGKTYPNDNLIIHYLIVN